MNTVVARGAVPAPLHATVQSVREAISGMVRVSADDLAEGVGNIIVTTSDQIIGGAFERSEAFRSWFHGSVMVNDDGSPKVMYHGSYRDFSTFDRMASARWRQTSIDTVGSWFSTEPGDTGAGMYASGKGAAIYPVYLAVKRPKYYETFGELLDAMHEAEGRDPKAQTQRNLGSAEGLRSLLIEQGYDGISLARTNTAELASELAQMRDAVRRAKDEEFAAPKGERPMYASKRERLEGTVARLEAEWRVCGDSTEFDGQLVVIAFEASQIKSAIGNRGTYDPQSSDIRQSMPLQGVLGTYGSTPFERWFGDSKVVDGEGKPLVVYRGEHGTGDGQPRTVLGSFTFVNDPAVASLYAQEPNDRERFQSAESPHVLPVHLAIQNPIIDNRDDPFVEFSQLIDRLGVEQAGHFARLVSERIMGTDNWDENFAGQYSSVAALLSSEPEKLAELYVDAYPLLDHPEFVQAAKMAGYDGAIHVGNGASLDALEFRVFDSTQIKSAIGNRGTYDPINADIRFSLSTPLRGRSQEFDRWFEGSCVVDDAGEPLVVYHGTTASFDSFKTGRRGAFFADDARSAGMYSGGDDGSNVMPVYLKIARPYRGHVGRKGPEIGEVIAAAKRGGHDGAIVTYDDFPGESAYVAFNPEQVKSALGNRGTYDAETPDIRHSLVATDEPKLVNLRSCAAAAHAAFATYEREVECGKEPDGDVYFALSNAVSEAEEAFTSGLLAMPESDFALRASTGDGRQLMLTRSAQRPGSYQLTRFDKEGMPWSDTQYLSKGQAVRHFLDESDVGTVVDFRGALPQRDSFDSWFGNSKVVDADGKPLVVYHGTAENFTKFRSGRGGFYFTGDKKAAQAYADNAESDSDEAMPRLVDAYLSIKNPMILGRLWYEENVLDEDGDPNWEAVDNMIYEAESLGHDGLILRGFSDFDGMEFVPGAKFGRRMQREYDQYVAFRPEQIKSATGNRGTYDPNDPDIRHSLAGLDARAQAFHDAGTNTTVFLADRIPAGREASVFLHEIVHRHGRQALPEGRWGALVGQVKAWGRAEPQSPERAIHDAAAARVATAGVAGALADEELFAYAVEEAVARGIEPSAAAVEGSAQAWLQAVVESIQRVADKLLGNDLQGLAGQDLVDLAYALAQLDSPEHGAEVRRALQEAVSEVNDVEPVRSADASFEGVEP